MDLDLDTVTHPGMAAVAQKIAELPIPETELQRQLKEKIAFHSYQASQLRTLLNTRLPISKLPPEILSEVFLNYAAMLRQERVALHTTSTAGDLDIHKPFYRWLNVSHVCRHWREVALKCASLWTWAAFEERIDTRFISLLLKRALDLPLTYVHTINSLNHCPSCITMDAFYGAAYDGLEFLARCLPRIRDLSIFIERDDFEDMWENLEDPDAPLLEGLRIEVVGTSRVSRRRLRGTVALEDEAFKTELPGLRSLTLTNIRFSLMHSLLHTSPSLRHLSITSCVCAADDSVPLFDDFLQVLHDLYNLETLTLDWCLQDLEAEGNHTIPPLPHLKLLRLSSRPGFLVNLIRYLDLPRKLATTVHYTYIEDDPLQDDDSLEQSESALKASLLSLFKQRTPSTIVYGAPVREDTLSNERVHTSCQVWASERPVDANGNPQHMRPVDSVLELDNVPPRLIYDDAKRGRDWVIAAEDVIEQLDLSNVHTVHLAEWDPQGAISKWDAVLEDAVNTTTFRVTKRAVHGLVENVLADVSRVNTAMDPMDIDDTHVSTGQVDSADGSSASRVIFPNLRVLQFVDVGIYEMGSDTPADWLRPGPFVECLRSRRKQGAPTLTRVDFIGCRSSDAALAHLSPLLIEGLVSELRWNGRLLTLPLPSS